MSDSTNPENRTPFGELMYNSPETILLKKLLELLDQAFDCRKQSILQLLLVNIPKLLGIIIVGHLAKNSDKIITWIKSLMIRLCYRQMTHHVIPKTLTHYFRQTCEKEITKKTDNTDITTISIYGFPVYFQNQANYCTLSYFPWFHTRFVNTIETEARTDYENSLKKTMTLDCKDLNGKKFNPATLFPSENYKRLDKIISSFFTVVEKSRMFKSMGILIDGEPGLGKSRSSDYLASTGKYGHVYYINLSLTTFRKMDFDQIVTKMLSINSTTSVVIYFDELDKYLYFYIREKYQKYMDKLKRESKSKKIDQNKENTETPNNTVQNETEQEIVLVDEFKEFERREKTIILNILLELIETNSFDSGVVFIFCSNNFDTIFEGVSMKHFASLRTRFVPIKFERCKKKEFIEYVEYFNNTMKDTDIWKDNLDKETIGDMIRDDLAITYRNIHKLHAIALYDVIKLIQKVNEYEEFSNSSDEGSLNSDPDIDFISTNKYLTRCSSSSEDQVPLKFVESKTGFIGDSHPIFQIARNGKVEELIQLLDKDPDLIHGHYHNGSQPLHFAAQHSNLECVKKLIELGSNPCFPNKDNQTPLHFAVESLSHDCIIELYKYYTPITAWRCVIRSYGYEVIEWIINDGFDINECIDFIPLNEALKIGVSPDFIEKLIEKYQLDLNAQDTEGNTSLHIAYRRGYNEKMCNFLKEHGADTTIQNNEGKIPSEMKIIKKT